MKRNNYRKESFLNHYRMDSSFHDLEMNLLLHSDKLTDLELTGMNQGEIREYDLDQLEERPALSKKKSWSSKLVDWISSGVGQQS